MTAVLCWTLIISNASNKELIIEQLSHHLSSISEIVFFLLGAMTIVEIIDAQSLLPFDINHDCAKSISKTNRLLVVDEDVPGGASAFILQQIVDEQNAYQFLDSQPQTMAAKAHRPAYGTDGDYFSKPSAEDIFEKVYAIMHEAMPEKYPSLY